MIKARAGEELDRTIRRLFPFLFNRAIDPNALSLVGLVVSLGAAAAFWQGAFRVGALLVLAGGFFDLVDGVVARAQDRSTTFGGFLDSSLDRVVDMALLLGLLMYWAESGEPLLAWTCAWALVASVMVSYTKARAESVLPDFRGGLLERAERVMILAVGALVGLLPLAVVLVAVGATATVFQRVALAHRGMAALDARKREEAAQVQPPLDAGGDVRTLPGS